MTPVTIEDVDRLRRLPLFGELDHHDLATVARWTRAVEVAAGGLLLEQGSLPHELFVIEDGTAIVVRDGETLAEIGPGDEVGEIALLKQQRRMASVQATSDLVAIALDAEALPELAESMPELATRLRETTERRLRSND
jgi:CRP-like cAMP-binding protein